MSPAERFEAPAPDGVATLRWVLAQLEGGSEDPAPGDVERFVSPDWRSSEGLLGGFRLWRGRLGSFEVRGVARTADDALEATLRDARDRSWRLRVRTDARGRLSATSLRRPAPPGFSIRPGRASDWEELAELERSCPTRTSDGSEASIDRGANLRPHFELQREHTIWVAEHEGRLVGARALTVREATLAGVPRRLCYSHFARILPAYQARGLFQPLNAMAFEQMQAGTDGVFAYMDPRNDAMRNAIGMAAEGYAEGWNVFAQRLVIRCEDHAQAGEAPRGRPEDAAHVARLVNACHGAEGFFSTYDEEVLADRFSRSPDAYAWRDLLVGERAVAGVWLAGERRRVETTAGVRESTRGLVLDYGFEGEDGLVELVALLRQWCALARDAGMTHLALFSSEPSPGWDRLSKLAEDVETFEFPCMVPAPPDLQARGLYVDAIYF